MKEKGKSEDTLAQIKAELKGGAICIRREKDKVTVILVIRGGNKRKFSINIDKTKRLRNPRIREFFDPAGKERRWGRGKGGGKAYRRYLIIPSERRLHKKIDHMY